MQCVTSRSGQVGWGREVSPGTGGNALGEKPKYAQNMCKICKYAQNLHNPENGVGSATSYLTTHTQFYNKIWRFFDQKEVLVILSTLKETFYLLFIFLVFWGVQKFVGPKNIHPKLPKYRQNMRKYAQSWKKKSEICTNMPKYAEICTAHIPHIPCRYR